MHGEILNDAAESSEQYKNVNQNGKQSPTEIFQLQSNFGNLIQKRTKKDQEETDAIRAGANYRFNYFDIFCTAFTIISRFLAIYFNIKLAIEFQKNSEFNYFLCTVACLCCSLIVTTIIQCFMYFEDGKFKNGFFKNLKICCFILLSSVFLRYWKCLVYACRCKQAEKNDDRESQVRFYKLTIREESDVAFIRLFECFLESAPQKILQISIALSQEKEITYLQILVICLHFGSMAWCLTVYHRYIRYSQEDKLNINTWGHICQLCWHFCTSVSRTLCISFVASIFPFWTIVWCFLKSLTTGIIIFIVSRPYCPKATFPNLLFCLIFGIIYLFTFISTKDESTRYKYIFYYSTCFLENISCIILFIFFATDAMKVSLIAFYSLCVGALLFYCFGIFVMIIYYIYYHPQITARKSKRFMINNN